MGWLAKTPLKSRAAVPELPISNTFSGSQSPPPDKQPSPHSPRMAQKGSPSVQPSSQEH